MTLLQTLARLKSLGNETTLRHNRKQGASANQFGVKLGDIRKVAADIRDGHQLAFELWETGNVDAQLLAILLLKPKQLTRRQLADLVESVTFAQVADWLNAYVVKQHPDKELLRQQWMTSAHPWAARAGWSLTAERVSKKQVADLDLPALLDRIEAEMGRAPAPVQWTMNSCLASIGIHFASHRKRAVAIGEKLGTYRDYPVSKGCTSPFAPIWIGEMVKRQE